MEDLFIEESNLVLMMSVVMHSVCDDWSLIRFVVFMHGGLIYSSRIIVFTFHMHRDWSFGRRYYMSKGEVIVWCKLGRKRFAKLFFMRSWDGEYVVINHIGNEY